MSTFYSLIPLFLSLFVFVHGDKLDEILGKHDAYCGTNPHRVAIASSTINETTLRIVGGTVADVLEFPWQVSLRRWSVKAKRWFHTCGGALIDNSWILTAAHCTMGKNVSADQFRVRLGEHDYSRVEGVEVDVNVSKILAHPGFNMETIEPDLNLLKLEIPLELNATSKIGPICISRLTEYTKIKEKTCFSSGWGKLKYQGGFPMILQKVSVGLVDSEECNKAYEGIANVTDSMICSGKDGMGTCEGDSGGPLQCMDEMETGANQTEPRWSLYGLTSWAVGCAEDKYPSVSARVAPFRDWIADVMTANE